MQLRTGVQPAPIRSRRWRLTAARRRTRVDRWTTRCAQVEDIHGPPPEQHKSIHLRHVRNRSQWSGDIPCRVAVLLRRLRCGRTVYLLVRRRVADPPLSRRQDCDRGLDWPCPRAQCSRPPLNCFARRLPWRIPAKDAGTRTRCAPALGCRGGQDRWTHGSDPDYGRAIRTAWATNPCRPRSLRAIGTGRPTYSACQLARVDGRPCGQQPNGDRGAAVLVREPARSSCPLSPGAQHDRARARTRIG
jgi:hypothetical protein